MQSQTSDRSSNSSSELDEILEKCEVYSNKVENASLHFVCIENVKEEITTSVYSHAVPIPGSNGTLRTFSSHPTWEKNLYVYDYQLIKQGGKVTEKRILLEENGEKKYEDNAPLKTKRFYSRWSALGPVILFSKNWQEKYSYRLVKKGRYKRERAFIIEVFPKKDVEKKLHSGKVWVSRKDGSIMKMEIDMESLPGFEELREKSKKRNIKPIFTIVHHYDFIKNGIRFPSKTYFEESYLSRGSRSTTSKTTFLYSNYKFFIVETDYVIKRQGA
jgi:hypothetical protein